MDVRFGFRSDGFSLARHFLELWFGYLRMGPVLPSGQFNVTFQPTTWAGHVAGNPGIFVFKFPLCDKIAPKYMLERSMLDPFSTQSIE